MLSAAAAVVTTSAWTRDRLLDRYALPPDRLHVAEPGVDPAELATGSAAGGELLCVAAVTPHKGHDVLLAALAMIADFLALRVRRHADRDPGFVDSSAPAGRRRGIDDRVSLVGPRTGAELDASYAAADLLVLASRAETYGMVVTEALARGIPVIATAVGGLPGAMGRGADGSRPGLLVPPGDAPALAAALRRWLGEPDLRQRLRRAARERRTTLSDWSATSERISGCWRRCGMTGRPTLGTSCPDELPVTAARDSAARTELPWAVQPVRVSADWLALREPADAAARATDLVEQVGAAAAAAGPGGDLRPWLRHRVDGPLARARGCPASSTGSCTTATPTCSTLAAAGMPDAARSPSRPGSGTSPGWIRPSWPARR